MATTLPEPLSLPWELKPMSSAVVGWKTLADRRKKYWVRHEVLKSVTPAMLVWWFGHLEGDVEIEGRVLNRYRVWHPFDHVSARYVRRAPDGSVGPGAQLALREVLGRESRYTVDVVSTIERLDEEGFTHKVVVRGLELARMEHSFRATPDGVLDENCLIVPGSHRLAFLSRVLVPWQFPASKGRAWLKHSIEEMGSLENFLPGLYQREAEAAVSVLPLAGSRTRPSMTTSRRIARLVGPTLIVLTVSETINLDIWKTNSPTVTYLNGTVLFVAGLAIVQAHNRWVRSWPVVITLVGWLAMALGMFRMFAPKAQQGGENAPTYVVMATILSIGIFLTIKAYRPTREAGAVSGLVPRPIERVLRLHEEPRHGGGRCHAVEHRNRAG